MNKYSSGLLYGSIYEHFTVLQTATCFYLFFVNINFGHST